MGAPHTAARVCKDAKEDGQAAGRGTGVIYTILFGAHRYCRAEDIGFEIGRKKKEGEITNKNKNKNKNKKSKTEREK